MKIGILALQGAFLEHQQMLEKLGVSTVQVRLAAQLDDLDGLIIPGGESTTIGKLAVDFEILDDLIAFGKTHAVWGTCAGAIFLSKDIHRDQPLLGLMDISIERNAFGRQVDSFETDLAVPVFAKNGSEPAPFPAVFIRAPLIKTVGEGVAVLAALPGEQIVAARQGFWLATSFHPELTNDDRFHRYFMEMISSK